jgi:16S rRNA (cytosine1402-N4)-methyltransferase
MTPLTHIPVLLKETLELLAPKKGETVLDVTLGLGGHAAAFLEKIGPSGKLIGLDTDPDNLAVATKNLERWKTQVDLRHANFRDLGSLDLPSVDIVFADLGLSSPHIDLPERGFTFREEGPLDLRFDRTRGKSAAEWIVDIDEKDLSRVFSKYGELKQARRLAERIKEVEPKTTVALAECVREIATYRAPSVLPQVFQALRIVVNDELGALDALLAAGPLLLKPGGRMGVMSYHSLEDRAVKNVFRDLATPKRSEETGAITEESPFVVLTKKPVRPSEEEAAENPRSRSAHLRVLGRRIF